MKLKRGFTLIELLVVIAILALLAGLLFPVYAQVRESGRAVVCLSNLKQIGTAFSLYLQDFDETYPMNRFPDVEHAFSGCIAEEGHPSSGLNGTSVNWKRAILPYVKSRAIFQCPSNSYAWRQLSYGYGKVPGDESNSLYPEPERLPTSYAYNGSFFHEAVPACWYGEKWERPRMLMEVDEPSKLILLLESRLSFPDLGTWFIPGPGPGDGSRGPFQAHNGACNWLFADLHVKRLKLAATCAGKMWTGRFVNGADGCAHIEQSAQEYR